MPTPKAIRARVAERRSQAIELRCAGTSWETIATTLGYATRGAACNDVGRALDQRLAALGGRADRLRQLALERLDITLSKLWPHLESDDPAVVNRTASTVVRIEERRARLEGTDAPTQLDAVIVAATTELGTDKPGGESVDEYLERLADREREWQAMVADVAAGTASGNGHSGNGEVTT
jgi:hypothetical protein